MLNTQSKITYAQAISLVMACENTGDIISIRKLICLDGESLDDLDFAETALKYPNAEVSISVDMLVASLRELSRYESFADRECFDAIKHMATIMKRDFPDHPIGIDQFAFFSTPWGFTTDDPEVFTMICLGFDLETDERNVGVEQIDLVRDYLDDLRIWGVSEHKIQTNLDLMFSGSDELLALLKA